MNGSLKLRSPKDFQWSRLLVWAFILLPVSLVQGQVKIYGQITSASIPLGGVRVDLQLRDSVVLLAYTFSDDKGIYHIQTVRKGKLALNFVALGYEKQSKLISGEDNNIRMDVQLMEGGVQQLQEVIVNSKQPGNIQKDTITLTAANFLQGNERSVEDLLKKIPGLNVGLDGSIRVGEKEVEKVMVEGDDFFEKGYRLLTQSMSVHPVEKVQVLQRYSNNKHLKGIENSDKVALNLQLKDDSKGQWIAELTAASTVFGTAFYHGQLSVMNIGKKNKSYLLGVINKDGVDAVSAIDQLIQPGQTNEPGQIGSDMSTPDIIDNIPSISGFDDTRTNFNFDRLFSINTIFQPAKALKVKWLAFFDTAKKSFYKNSVQEYRIQDIQFSYSEKEDFSKQLTNYFSRIELQFDINKAATLTYTGNVGSPRQTNVGDLLFNGSPTSEISRKWGFATNHNLSHTQKLSAKSAIVSSIKWIRQDSPQRYFLDQYFYQDIFKVDSASGVDQQVENGLHYLGIISQYIFRRNKSNYFEAALSSEHYRKILRSDLFLRSEDLTLNRPAGFSNRIDFRVHYSSVMLKYTIKNRVMEWTPQLRVGLRNDALHTIGGYKTKKNLLVSPQLAVKWEVHPKGVLESLIHWRQRNTDLMEIVPNYYTSGLRTFAKGLDELATLSTRGVNLKYTFGNMLDRFFANLTLGFEQQPNYISSRSMVTTNVNLVEDILLKNKTQSYCNTQLNYYVGLFKGNFKLDLGINWSDYATDITGIGSRKIRSETQTYELSFRSVWKYWLNIHVSNRTLISSLKTETSTRLSNNVILLNCLFNVSANIQANLRNEAYAVDQILSHGHDMYYFSDFSLSYDIKPISTRLELAAKNLFNTHQYKNSVITDTYSDVTVYRLLPRYVQVGVSCRF